MPKKRAQDSAPDLQPITREIRSAIADDNRSLYALARDAGVDEAAVRRFVSRERSLSLDSADRLAAALNLSVIRRARPRAKVPPKRMTPEKEMA